VVDDLATWRPRPTEAELTAQVGMLVFLVAWSMLFAALFFAYGLLRGRAAAWPPPDLPPLPRLVPGLATLGLGASSLAVDRAARACRPNAHRAAARWLALATLLGAGFLLLQLQVWAGLWRAGLTPEGGPYPSVFYGLTAFHALHVLVGLCALGWLAWRAHRRGAPRLGVKLWGTYWHFVGVVWLVMYAAVYLA
jgi:heme/copper-type cytochrome/quinol oxidase subunit 3